jgi:hypothetical protein
MKRVILLLFFISFVIEAQAQRTIHRRKSIYVGGLQGVTTSQISGDAHKGFKKFGMMGGLFVIREINQSLTLQIEAIYKEKGSRYHAPPVADTAAVPSPYYETPTEGYLLKMNYIEFPVLLQYTFSELSRFTGLIVELGPGFGIPVHIEEYVTVPGFNNRQYGPPFNYYEISYNVGLSYYLKSNIGFNFRFSRSANAVRDYYKGEKATTLSPGQQNTVLSFSVNYRFKL